MNRGTLLVFGSKLDSIDRIKNMGYRTVQISETKVDDCDRFFPLSGEDGRYGRYTAEQFAELFNEDYSGFIVLYEDLVPVAAFLRDHYCPHLLGLTMEQATTCRDKWKCKNKLIELDIPTTKIAALSPRSTFEEIERSVGNPFIVKPRNEAESIGIEIIRNHNDFNVWLQQNMKSLDQFFCEQYISKAREFSCDSIVSRGKTIMQITGEFSVTALDSRMARQGFGVCFPGFATEQINTAMKEMSLKFLEKMGIRDAFAHIEFLMDQSGKLYLGEIGCSRFPGAWVIPTQSAMLGTSIIDIYVKIFSTKETPPSEFIDVTGKFMGFHLFPKNPGKVKSIECDLDKSWILDYGVRIKEGETLPQEVSSITTSAYAMFKANSPEEHKSKAAEITKLFRVNYES